MFFFLIINFETSISFLLIRWLPITRSYIYIILLLLISMTALRSLLRGTKDIRVVMVRLSFFVIHIIYIKLFFLHWYMFCILRHIKYLRWLLLLSLFKSINLCWFNIHYLLFRIYLINLIIGRVLLVLSSKYIWLQVHKLFVFASISFWNYWLVWCLNHWWISLFTRSILN